VGASTAIGGPAGRHARLDHRRFWTPVRWLVLITLLTSLLGFWQKSPCRVHPWTEQYQYTRACYTDVFALYFAERLSAGATPYLEHPVEYPVVIGGVMAVAAEITEAFPQEQRPRRFYDVTWALLTACAVVVTVTTARLAGRRRVWDAAMFAAAPLLVLHGSTNWDLVAMALAGLGLVQWARSRPLAAGVLLGAATATKLYPLLFLVPLLALCLRAGRLRAFAVTAVATVLTPVALTLPVYLASPSYAEVGGTQTQVADSPWSRLGEQGLAALAPHVSATAPDGSPVVGVNATYRFVELNRLRPADWDSLWFALQTVRGTPLDTGGQTPTTLNTAVAVLLLVALAGIVVLALAAPRRPRLMALLFLTVLAFLLTNKVWSPQFSLWLVPLALLARSRWRPFLAWQAAEVLVLLSRFYFFIGSSVPGEGIPVGLFLSAVLLRDATLVGYAALVVRDVLRPEHDVVRQDGADDPAGGVLDGAPGRRAGGDADQPRVKTTTSSYAVTSTPGGGGTSSTPA
jgi:uncharacterized membrane protein